MADPRCRIEDLAERARGATLASGPIEVDCAHAARLPVRALTALALLPAARLIAVSADAALALAVLGLDGRLADPQRVAAPAAAGSAFTAHCEAGSVVIDVERKAADDGRLAQAQSHRWIAGLAAEVVIVDFARLEHVNSSIVAWLLLLVQAAKPARIELRHVHRQVQAQLTQLRLNHLLTVTEG